MADDPQRPAGPGGAPVPTGAPGASPPEEPARKAGATAIFSMKMESWMSDIAADFQMPPPAPPPPDGQPLVFYPESSDP